MSAQIVYYVASSIDGYIAGPGENIAGFVAEGNGVEKYLQDLKKYQTVLMGRKTYEFGYKFGLQPGQKAYPHMKHYIFSRTLKFSNQDPEVIVCSLNLKTIEKIKSEANTDIYLCGGGELAAWLLQHQFIDVVKLKLNPFISGSGIPLFTGLKQIYQLEWEKCESFDNGLQMITYRIK